LPAGVAIAFADIEIIVAHPSWLWQDEGISPWSMDTPGIGGAMRGPFAGRPSGVHRQLPQAATDWGDVKGIRRRAPTTATLLLYNTSSVQATSIGL